MTVTLSGVLFAKTRMLLSVRYKKLSMQVVQTSGNPLVLHFHHHELLATSLHSARVYNVCKYALAPHALRPTLTLELEQVWRVQIVRWTTQRQWIRGESLERTEDSQRSKRNSEFKPLLETGVHEQRALVRQRKTFLSPWTLKC